MAAPPSKGTRWTAEEDAALLREVGEGLSRARISEAHGRTEGGIRSRLAHTAARLVAEGAAPEEASRRTGVSVEDIAAEAARKAVPRAPRAPRALTPPPSTTAPEPLSPTPEQQAALDAVRSGRDVFLTGPAGTGKSATLAMIRRWAASAEKAVVLTATTGAAAALVGGATLHSFLGIGTGGKPVAEMAAFARYRLKPVVARVCAMDVLVIDEASMLSAELFDKVVAYVEELRSRDGAKPFQLVLSGDFCQLPPVQGRFCFAAESWKARRPTVVQLTRLLRQSGDAPFQEMLMRLRWGRCSPEDEAALRALQHTEFEDGLVPTRLFSLNADVDRINDAEYAALLDATGGRSVAFPRVARDERSQRWADATGFPERVDLCVGAQVMVRRRWVGPVDPPQTNPAALGDAQPAGPRPRQRKPRGGRGPGPGGRDGARGGAAHGRAEAGGRRERERPDPHRARPAAPPGLRGVDPQEPGRHARRHGGGSGAVGLRVRPGVRGPQPRPVPRGSPRDPRQPGGVQDAPRRARVLRDVIMQEKCSMGTRCLSRRILLVDSSDRDTTKYPSPGSYVLTLPVEYRNVVRVRLLTVEVPTTFYAFTAAFANVTVGACVYDLSGNSSAVVPIQIGNGNYDASTLASTLQGLLNTAFPQATFAMTFSAVTGKFVTTVSGSTVSKFAWVTVGYTSPSLVRWGLGFHLGLDPNAVVAGTTVTGPHVMKLASSNYLLLNIKELNSMDNTGNTGGHNTNFSKILLDGDAFSTIYSTGDCCTVNESILSPPLPRLNRLTIDWQFHDGLNVDFNNVDHSFTLELELAE